MGKDMGKDKKRRRGLLRLVSWSLMGLAVTQELRKPSSQRTWEGRVAGFVPYDFRAPTADRVRSSLWNPKDPRLVTPQPFGVGWTLNFGRIWALFRGQ